MRLLNRLNQYQRLWQPSAGKPQTVTVSELAERCFCSERHVRTLRQAQEAGWLEWQARCGRRRKARTITLSGHAGIATQCDDGTGTGNRKAARCAGAGATGPGELRTLLQPFMGGQWQNDTPTLRIPYYRPLEPLQPGLPGRAEQHLAGQIFSGLTRFDNNTQRPIGDLAHHWETSTDGLRWDFYLRSTLHWHNGDAVKASALTPAIIDAVTTASTGSIIY